VSYTLIRGKRFTSFFLIFVLVNIIPISYAIDLVNGQASFSGMQPIINDSNLKAELVFKGLKSPTSMVFLGPNDILVLEKDQGTVQRIINGNMPAQPLLQVNVATDGERGMLGIAITKNVTNGTPFVFLLLY
jgi:aldose sugar dehydrogenase